jgi:protein-glucosylgalactosylhydroxylysine glucosidase
MTNQPLSPPPVTSDGVDELPAYLSNGLIGLRVLDIPMRGGAAMVCGLAGLHSVTQIEAAAQAPYPLAGDIAINGVWLSESPNRAIFREQRYDFSCGELTTRFDFSNDGTGAHVEVLTLCSRSQPTVVMQETTIRTDAAAEVTLRAGIDPGGVPGEWLGRETSTPDEPQPAVDGSLHWGTLGGLGSLGVAYITEFRGAVEVEGARQSWGEHKPLATDYGFRAQAGRPYRLRQLTSLVPTTLHNQPDRQAVRLAARAGHISFDTLREENRVVWQELWRGRINLVGADERWQQLTDAAFFYLNTSVHAASPASTSIFGLAQWNDYHYYYGHVMWDVETFAVPPLMLLQPDAARALLEFRTRTTEAARNNANLSGRNGYQFPWEAGMSRGEEAAPGSGKASWYEDHVTLDVAWAFAQFAHTVGDGEFDREELWPLLHGVADWLESRVHHTARGYEIRRAMGIAERPEPSDNEAFTAMAARVVMAEAVDAAKRLGRRVPDIWQSMAEGIVIPMDSRGRYIVSHDRWHPNESKGATPGPLAGLFPFWYPATKDVEAATIARYLELAPDYIGSPMLSSLYGVWAAWCGDRALAARLLDEGYGQFATDRFMQTLETRPDRDPELPRAGPFFANLAGYLTGLLYGFPGIRPTAADPSDWPNRPVVLPAGWDAIEVERVWVRGRPARLEARHGAEAAVIEVDGADVDYRSTVISDPVA